MSTLVDRSLRKLRRGRTPLTPEDACRWLRAYWAEIYRSNRFGSGDAKLWPEVMRSRRASRRWEKELLALPAFRRVVLAFDGVDMVEMFEALSTLGSTLGYMRTQLRLQERDPIHPSQWGDNLRRLREDAAKLREVARNQPRMAATLNEYAGHLEWAAKHSPADQWAPFDRANIGTRGAAATDVDSAMRGWFVTELLTMLPENVEQRDATAAALLRHAGMDITPDRVRTIRTNRERFRP